MPARTSRSRGRWRACWRRRGWSAASARPRGSASAPARRRSPPSRRTPAAVCRGGAWRRAVERRHHVAPPVQLGPLHGLADQRLGREVQHAVEAVGEHLVRSLREVGLDEPRLRRHRVAVAGRQVVEHDHLVAGVHQVRGAHTADVAGATGDEQLHGHPPRTDRPARPAPRETCGPGAVPPVHRLTPATQTILGEAGGEATSAEPDEHGVRDVRGDRGGSGVHGAHRHRLAEPARSPRPGPPGPARCPRSSARPSARRPPARARRCGAPPRGRLRGGRARRAAAARPRTRPARNGRGLALDDVRAARRAFQLLQPGDRVAVGRHRGVVQQLRRACARRPRSSRAPSGTPRRARTPTPGR